MVDLWRDFWIRETGTGQQVAQLHERYDNDDDEEEEEEEEEVGWLMSDKLGRIRKEEAVSKMRLSPSICLEGLSKTTNTWQNTW